MRHPMKLTALLALTSLMLTPALPSFDGSGSGAAFAEGKGNGGSDKSEKSEKSEKSDKGGKSEKSAKSGKSEKATKTATVTKKKSAPKPAKKPAPSAKAASQKVTKPKAAVEEEVAEMHPSELGKMNGALNASINAITAHIKNGQTTNGPVGLMAGLAIADVEAAESLANVQELEALADAHTALSDALADASLTSVEDYLAVKDTLSPETQAAMDALIADAGGLSPDGLALATSAPTDEELAAAHAEASTDAEGVTAAEDAFVAAWNKDGDPEELLSLARDRLEPYADEIAEAVALAAEAEVDPEVEAEADVTPEDGDEALLLPEPPEAG